MEHRQPQPLPAPSRFPPEPGLRRPREAHRRWPASPLVRSLERFARLGHDERGALSALTARFTPYAARAELVEPGAPPRRDVIIVSGYACRYKLRPGGERQI